MLKNRRWIKERVILENNKRNDNSEYEILDDYNVTGTGNKATITVKCSICNNVWKPIVFHFFKNKTGCPNCKRGKLWTENRLFDEMDRHKDYELYSYDIISNQKSRIRLRHILCGHIFEREVQFIARKTLGCEICGRGKRWTSQRTLDEWKLLRDNKNYTLLKNDEVNSRYSRITIKCTLCDSIWSPTVHDFFVGGTRCPTCRSSNGERKIIEVLNSLAIKYETQRKFDTCVNKRALPFDFFLPEYNTLIEFQGVQHFRIVECFGGNAGFENCIANDTIKSKWCKENGYNLLEIFFDEIDDVEHIIREHLNFCNRFDIEQFLW